MVLFAFNEWWNDFFAAGGFWVGVFGTVLGLVGFAIAIYQIVLAKRATMEAKTAAEAARDAAEKTFAENKEAYERFVGAFASRLLSELNRAVHGKDWKLANLRCDDLAELLATLPSSENREQDEAVTESVRSLREFAQTYARMVTSKAAELSRPNVKKWEPLLQLLHNQLDYLRRPFRENSDGQVGSDDSAGKVSDDNPEPSGEDESGTSKLDSPPDPKADA
jgi:hypothetical protein